MPLPLQFHDALHAFIRLAMEHVKQAIATGLHVPTEIRTVAVRSGETGWHSESRDRPLWGIALLSLEEPLKVSTEFRECARLMSEIPVIASQTDRLVYIGWMGMRWDVDRALLGFLAELLQREGGPLLNESSFTALYDHLENFIVDKEVEAECWVPLENLKCIESPIRLGLGMEILTMPKDVFEDLFYVSESNYRFEEVVRWESVLHLTFTIPKSATPEGASSAAEQYRTAEDVLTAIRLLKSSRVVAGPSVTRYRRWMPIIGTGYGRRSEAPHPFNSIHELTFADSQPIIAYLQSVQKVRKSGFPNLTLALRRFNYSYERSRSEDRLIDQMIAFETLFLADIGDDNRGEKRFRLALRVSYFLDHGPNRKTINQDMKHAYDMRSRIIHGGDSSTDLEDVARKAEEYLRQSLVKFLEHAAQPNATRELVCWDDLLFSEKPPPA